MGQYVGWSAVLPSSADAHGSKQKTVWASVDIAFWKLAGTEYSQPDWQSKNERFANWMFLRVQAARRVAGHLISKLNLMCRCCVHAPRTFGNGTPLYHNHWFYLGKTP